MPQAAGKDVVDTRHQHQFIAFVSLFQNFGFPVDFRQHFSVTEW